MFSAFNRRNYYKEEPEKIKVLKGTFLNLGLKSFKLRTNDLT